MGQQTWGFPPESGASLAATAVVNGNHGAG